MDDDYLDKDDFPEIVILLDLPRTTVPLSSTDFHHQLFRKILAGSVICQGHKRSRIFGFFSHSKKRERMRFSSHPSAISALPLVLLQLLPWLQLLLLVCSYHACAVSDGRSPSPSIRRGDRDQHDKRDDMATTTTTSHLDRLDRSAARSGIANARGVEDALGTERDEEDDAGPTGTPPALAPMPPALPLAPPLTHTPPPPMTMLGVLRAELQRFLDGKLLAGGLLEERFALPFPPIPPYHRRQFQALLPDAAHGYDDEVVVPSSDDVMSSDEGQPIPGHNHHHPRRQRREPGVGAWSFDLVLVTDTPLKAAERQEWWSTLVEPGAQRFANRILEWATMTTPGSGGDGNNDDTDDDDGSSSSNDDLEAWTARVQQLRAEITSEPVLGAEMLRFLGRTVRRTLRLIQSGSPGSPGSPSQSPSGSTASQSPKFSVGRWWWTLHENHLRVFGRDFGHRMVLAYVNGGRLAGAPFLKPEQAETAGTSGGGGGGGGGGGCFTHSLTDLSPPFLPPSSLPISLPLSAYESTYTVAQFLQHYVKHFTQPVIMQGVMRAVAMAETEEAETEEEEGGRGRRRDEVLAKLAILARIFEHAPNLVKHHV